MSIYKDFPKDSAIWQVSNPKIVRDRYHSMYSKYIKNMGYKSEILPSTRKHKKYMVIGPDGKLHHFGDIRYEDFTKHNDEERRQRYLNRFNKSEDLDPYSPYLLAKNLLW